MRTVRAKKGKAQELTVEYILHNKSFHYKYHSPPVSDPEPVSTAKSRLLF